MLHCTLDPHSPPSLICCLSVPYPSFIALFTGKLQDIIKPLVYRHYVDDIFLIWQHGQQALEEFMTELNDICSSIKFTKELEQDGKLAFLHIQISRFPDGSLGSSL